MKTEDIFPKTDELDRSIRETKAKKGKEIPIISKKVVTSKKGRKTKEEVEEEKGSLNNLTGKEKNELIDILFNENQDIDFINIIPKVLKTGKTISSLKGVRETLEDVLNIQQLSELIGEMRTQRTKPNKSNAEKKEEEEEQTTNNLLSIMPFLSKMQNEGFNAQGIDPNMLLLATMNQGSGRNNAMTQFLLMMSMANILGAGKQNANGSNSPITGEVFSKLADEFKNVMAQQQQKPPIDPQMLLILNMLNKNASNNDNVERILAKMTEIMNTNRTNELQMVMQNTNAKFERIFENLAGALHANPTDKLLESFNLFNTIRGTDNQMSKDMMDFKLKEKEMLLQEEARRDMLNREEREIERNAAKSDRIMSTAEKVLEKIVGEGVGALARDLVSAKRAAKGSPATSTREFSASDLDELDV